MILAFLEDSWALLDSLGLPLDLLGAVLGLSRSGAPLVPPGGSFGSLLALKGAPGGLQGSFSVDLSVDF